MHDIFSDYFDLLKNMFFVEENDLKVLMFVMRCHEIWFGATMHNLNIASTPYGPCWEDGLSFKGGIVHAGSLIPAYFIVSVVELKKVVAVEAKKVVAVETVKAVAAETKKAEVAPQKRVVVA